MSYHNPDSAYREFSPIRRSLRIQVSVCVAETSELMNASFPPLAAGLVGALMCEFTEQSSTWSVLRVKAEQPQLSSVSDTMSLYRNSAWFLKGMTEFTR